MIKKSRLLMLLLPVLSGVALTVLLYLVMGSRQFSSHREVTGLTVEPTDNTFAYTGGEVVTGDKVYFNAGVGTLPEGITGGQRYFARKDAASAKLTLHPTDADASGGQNTVALSDPGTGEFKLFIDSDLYLYALLMKRGPIQWATMFLSFWTASILAWKLFFSTKENRCWNHVPFAEDTKITRDDSGNFIDLIRNSAAAIANSQLGNRLIIGLENFRSHGKVQEVVDVLSVQSDIDSRESDNSYTMIKVFLASIPILGFIGTVYGIGTAVGGFGNTLEGATEVNAIKNSLSGVTAGLSVAFDTTLLALVMSIILMIPLGSVQQFEEKSLNEIDDYVNNKFVNFLQETDDANGAPAEAVREAIQQSMGAMQAQTTETKTFFKEQMGELAEKIPSSLPVPGDGQAASELREALGQIQGLHREQLQMLSHTTTAISQHGEKLQEVFEANTGFLNNWGTQFTEHLRESQGALVQSEGRVAEQLDNSSKTLASETDRVVNVYKEMGNEFASELTQFFEKSLGEMQQKMSQHLQAEQGRMETLLARQEQATSGYSEAVQLAMDQLAESTTRWQGREAELLGQFEQKAQQHIEVMSGAFRELVDKQVALVESARAIQSEAQRQTEVCQQLIPQLATTAEQQITRTRENADAAQQESNKRHAEVLNEMQEQTRQQTEILRDCQNNQQTSQQSLERLTDRWDALARHIDSAAPEGGKKRGWWPFGKK